MRVARELLRPYLAASRIGGLVRAMSAIWAKGDRFYGTDACTSRACVSKGGVPSSTTATTPAAWAWMNSVTGQIVPGSAGVPRDNLVTRLDLVRGHWLVAFQLVEDVPCTP